MEMKAAIETPIETTEVEKAPSPPRGPVALAIADAESKNIGESDRNPIFDALVTPDEDVTGLVAYSIYKQNKRAWLDDFVKATGRMPNEAESRAYLIGENTERRLNTYRRLAAETLAGKGSWTQSSVAAALKASPFAGALWALAVVAALAVLGLALHAGYLAPAK
jgi:hypothetical protein